MGLELSEGGECSCYWRHENMSDFVGNSTTKLGFKVQRSGKTRAGFKQVVA